jgi:hypothetical protein
LIWGWAREVVCGADPLVGGAAWTVASTWDVTAILGRNKLADAVEFLASHVDHDEVEAIAAQYQLHAIRERPRQGGHVHVDFVRTEAAWQLREIWICR